MTQPSAHRRRKRLLPFLQVPGAYMSWLSYPAPIAERRRLMTPAQRRIFWALVAVLAVMILLIVFPVERPSGPVLWLYYVHDTVILPLRGRVFERYAPVPQLAVLALLLLGLFSLIARRFSQRVHIWMTRRVLDNGSLTRLLRSWLSKRPRDSVLAAEIEAWQRDAFLNWYSAPTSASERLARSASERALDLLGAATSCGSNWTLENALVQVAARALVLDMKTKAGRSAELFQQVAALSGGQTEIAQLLLACQSKEGGRQDLLSAWSRVSGSPARRAALRDSIAWCAVVHALYHQDAGALYALQKRWAKDIFKETVSGAGRSKGQSFPSIDPMLCDLAGVEDGSQWDSGFHFDPEVITALKDGLRRQSGHA